MFQPRNTLVAVAELKTERTTEHGLVIPSGTGREYKVCHVVEVGPGMITQKDEVSPCADLRKGQTVLVKLHRQRRLDQNTVGLEPIGVDFKTNDDRAITLVEQSQIVAIIDEPRSTVAEA
jgi:co-chaperonin GroES (HSP10)